MKDKQNDKQLELPDSSSLVRIQFHRKKNTEQKKNAFSPLIPPSCCLESSTCDGLDVSIAGAAYFSSPL